MSMNKYNNLMDFHKYTETKPDAGVRREILNMFNEYKDQENKEHARDELIDICEKYQIEKFQFVGYYFANSLAEKPADFRQYINLVFEYFFEDQKIIDGPKLLESVNVMCANLPDLIIDYPNAKLYANEILQKSVGYKIINCIPW